MVLGLCFSAGIRLIAVGDVDQSIYGFTGADPLLLQQLAARGDVKIVHLRLNYRCGSNIVTAASYRQAAGSRRQRAGPALRYDVSTTSVQLAVKCSAGNDRQSGSGKSVRPIINRHLSQ
jgi:superfamily I DNA/RNA helicase